MSVPTRRQVNWAKNTAMRIMEEVEQAVIRQDSTLVERRNLGTECLGERYSVNIGDADALCNTLYHLHTIYGPLMVVVEGRETNGEVWVGCYSMEVASNTPDESASTDTSSNETIAERVANFEVPRKTTGPRPAPSSPAHQIFSTLPTKEESPSLVAKNATGDSDLPEQDYESVDLSGNTELDEKWVDVEYPAGSNGWWRVRQRAKGLQEGRRGN